MRIAVIGGTGLAGRHTVDAVQRGGHEAVVVARSRGVDVVTGAGLDGALANVDAVIDATNVLATDAQTARRLFGAATQNLLAAEERARVRHHVLLSIVGIDRLEGNAHYAGKRVQEEILSSGSIPFTIQRTTQFHEFAGMVVGWLRRGDTAMVPPLLVQPVAASDVGEVLAEIAAGPAQGRAPDLAGPEVQDLFDMARRTLSARGESIRMIPSWRNGLIGIAAAGEILLPGPEARLGPTTFDTWVAGQRPAFDSGAAAGDEAQRVTARYEQLLDAWNRRSADEFAALFTADGHTVGFDGSPIDGREAIVSTLREIFASHQTASYVAKVREVRRLSPSVTLLRAVVGMIPPGQTEINPAVNALQTVVFVEQEGLPHVSLLQSTPAAFHGRPQLAQQLTEELTSVARAPRE